MIWCSFWLGLSNRRWLMNEAWMAGGVRVTSVMSIELKNAILPWNSVSFMTTRLSSWTVSLLLYDAYLQKKFYLSDSSETRLHHRRAIIMMHSRKLQRLFSVLPVVPKILLHDVIVRALLVEVRWRKRFLELFSGLFLCVVPGCVSQTSVNQSSNNGVLLFRPRSGCVRSPLEDGMTRWDENHRNELARFCLEFCLLRRHADNVLNHVTWYGAIKSDER